MVSHPSHVLPACLKLRGFRNALITIIAAAAAVPAAVAQVNMPHWATHGGTHLHRSPAPAATQPLERVLWWAQVDRQPQYTGGGALLIHYGSPVITKNNVIIFPVKTRPTDSFVIEARNGETGALIYKMGTDYSLPTGTSWLPSCGIAISPGGQLYVPGGGGTVLRRHRAEDPASPSGRRAFYGIDSYLANRDTYNTNVKINTPLTPDGRGNIYFGYRVYGPTPTNLVSGIAKIASNGTAIYRDVVAITGDPDAARIQTQCAPAVSMDHAIVYVAIQRGSGGGYLVGLNTTDLSTVYQRRLFDPATGNDAIISGQSTASPMIGRNGDVFFGILSNPHAQHNGRGYLLHFDKTLAVAKLPGSFGWDTTPTLVPSSSVPGYTGTSTYLILTKYNNYAGFGTGDGVNKTALLDPFQSQPDSISGIPVMKEIYTVTGPTPDPNHVGTTYPNAVWEWCINAAVFDPATNSAIINSEDGFVYRWDLATNSLTQVVKLDKALGQAYTPTISGPTGIVYAINNAKLFAVGANAP